MMLERIQRKITAAMRATVRAYYKIKTMMLLETEEVKCILCEKSDFKELYGKDRYNLPLKTKQCTDCGTVMQNPMPTENFLRKFYGSKMYRGLYRGVLTAKKSTVEKSLLNSAANFKFVSHLLENGMIKKSAETHILDFGCSDGSFIANIKKNFSHFKVYGIEPGTNFSDFNKSNVDGLFCGTEDLPDDMKFDIITSWHVLEHTREPLAILGKLRRHLVGGGFLLIEVPDVERYEGIRNIHIGHLYHFSKKTMREILEKCGFSVQEITENFTQDARFGMKIICKKESD